MSERFDVSGIAKWDAADYPVGAICPDAGNSREYATGGWRSERPIWDKDACKDCLICWIDCPESSIIVEEKAMTGIDLDHCKGCGICVNECPFGALSMVLESACKEKEGDNA
jgi:pyruvate ferredoxin oxidoreductase delta subunit